MPGTPTPLLNLTVPTVGADVGTWGSELNADLAILDGLGAYSASNSSVGRTLAYGPSPVTIAWETGGAGGITDVLPTAIGHRGQGFHIKKIDSGAGAVVLSTTGGQTIEGDASFSTYNLVNKGQYISVISDGTNWQISANN
jgi:hypothetical protein